MYRMEDSGAVCEWMVRIQREQRVQDELDEREEQEWSGKRKKRTSRQTKSYATNGRLTASAIALRKLLTAAASINGPISVFRSSGSPIFTCALGAFGRR